MIELKSLTKLHCFDISVSGHMGAFLIDQDISEDQNIVIVGWVVERMGLYGFPHVINI